MLTGEILLFFFLRDTLQIMMVSDEITTHASNRTLLVCNYRDVTILRRGKLCEVVSGKKSYLRSL